MRLPRFPRVIGFDDGPFPRRPGAVVPVVGVVCSGTRFEGLVWGRVRKDGWSATPPGLSGCSEGKPSTLVPPGQSRPP